MNSVSESKLHERAMWSTGKLGDASSILASSYVFKLLIHW